MLVPLNDAAIDSLFAFTETCNTLEVLDAEDCTNKISILRQDSGTKTLQLVESSNNKLSIT